MCKPVRGHISRYEELNPSKQELKIKSDFIFLSFMEKYAQHLCKKRNRHKHINKATKIHLCKDYLKTEDTFLKQKIKCYSIFSRILSHSHTYYR